MTERGRPIKLTPELTEEIVAMIRAGNYIETAAAGAGLSKVTLYNWMRRGKREEERVAGSNRKISKKEAPFVDFLNAVKKALAESEMHDIQTISDAAEHDWKAAAWRLERKFPERWGKKVLSHNNDMERLKLEKLQAEIAKAHAEIAKLMGDDGADYEDDGFMEALDSTAAEVWADEMDN